MINTKKKILMSFLLVSLYTPSIFAESFDHHYVAFGELLKQYENNGLVHYQAIQKSPELLNRVLTQFADATESDYRKWRRNEQVAFWINAYNVAVIKTVADHYPLEKGLSWKALAYPSNSIQQIPNVWNRPAFDVFGEKVSLNHIENEILRKEFKVPRIHFALVCASLGCPVLRREPYLADKLDLQLNEQISDFLADSEKFRYNRDTDTLYLSPIFKWFKKDFEQIGGIQSFLKVHLPDDVGKSISAKTKIEWLDYDWSLNERK
jgi:hypothetical protein